MIVHGTAQHQLVADFRGRVLNDVWQRTDSKEPRYSAYARTRPGSKRLTAAIPLIEDPTVVYIVHHRCGTPRRYSRSLPPLTIADLCAWQSAGHSMLRGLEHPQRTSGSTEQPLLSNRHSTTLYPPSSTMCPLRSTRSPVTMASGHPDPAVSGHQSLTRKHLSGNINGAMHRFHMETGGKPSRCWRVSSPASGE